MYTNSKKDSMRTLLMGLLLMLSIPVFAQQTVRLNFLYGSKPANGYKSVESKYFGGLKGGHVNIEVNGRVLDFLPGIPAEDFRSIQQYHGIPVTPNG
jgi:hypothetical protein